MTCDDSLCTNQVHAEVLIRKPSEEGGFLGELLAKVSLCEDCLNAVWEVMP